MLLIVFLIFQLSASVYCACISHANCASCSGAPGDLFQNCRWCPYDNMCHEPGAVATNLCTSGQNIVNPAKCGWSEPTPTAYDSEIARYLLFFANSSYIDDELNPTPLKYLPRPASRYQLIANFNSDPGFCKNTSWSYYKYVCSTRDWYTLWYGYGFLVADTMEQRLVLAFRGNEGMMQILFDDIPQTSPIHPLIPVPNGPPNVMVVKYFWEFFENFNPIISSALQSAVQHWPTYQLFITGHSMGGAFASLAAFFSAPDLSPTVYTFGQPRTGNTVFANLYNKQIPQTFRLVVDRDPVPHLPACVTAQYTLYNPSASKSRSHSVCNNTLIENPFHTGTEIWYPSGDFVAGTLCGFKVCIGPPFGEDLTCSDSLTFKTDITDHLISRAYGDVLIMGFCGNKLT